MAAAVALLKLAGGLANEATASMALMLVVLFAARQWGSASATVAAVAGALALNYFFLPPIGTLDVASPLNIVALAVFVAAALTVGELSARARRRTAEAEASRRDAERLYRELQSAFDAAAEAEALRRSDRLKSALVDAVTHELRTPLTAIKASTTALLRDEGGLEPGTRQELLEIVEQEADRLDGLVEELVGAARLESRTFTLQCAWVAPEDVIADAVARAAPRLAGRRIEVDVPSTIPSVFADARALSEALFQLLDNAAKYSPEGRPIRVSAAAADAAVDVRVDDEGPGVPAAERQRIFDKFYRAPRTAGTASGLGMGLAVARGLVEAHGGALSVSDRPGGSGARFTLRVPVGDADEAPAAASRP